MHEIILLKISGEDKPGVMMALTAILDQYDIRILDIGQAVIHNTLSLGIIIQIPTGNKSAPALKDLLYKSNELALTLKFVPVTIEDHEKWVHNQGQKRYIVTLLAREITSAHLRHVSKVITDNGLNIDSITRLSGRISLENPVNRPRGCVELTLRGQPDNIAYIRTEFMNISRRWGVDIAFQEDNVYRRNRRLVAFDMDSTLIAAEVIDELAKKAGLAEQVSKITASAMRGELDFNDSLKNRVLLLKGLEASVLEDVAKEIDMTEGARRLISNLKDLGYKIAILSGGFTYFGKKLQSELGVDYVYANELEIKKGKLTGKLTGKIVDGPQKAALLKKIAKKENISLQQTVAVGDGANDLPMLHLAGLGIAFHAKPIVKKDAKQAISTLGLDGILYLLGLRDREAK